MPNWTTNEVTFSSAKTTNIKKIKDIFENNIFGKFLSTVSIGKDFGNLRKIEI